MSEPNEHREGGEPRAPARESQSLPPRDAPRPVARWKVASVLAAVFLLGGAAGAAVGRATAIRDLSAAFRGPPGEARAQFRVEALRRHLGLDPQQVAKLQTVLGEAEAERDRLVEPCRADLDELRARTDERVRAILTPEQRARYDERERFRPPPGGPHGPPSGRPHGPRPFPRPAGPDGNGPPPGSPGAPPPPP